MKHHLKLLATSFHIDFTPIIGDFMFGGLYVLGILPIWINLDRPFSRRRLGLVLEGNTHTHGRTHTHAQSLSKTTKCRYFHFGHLMKILVVI